MRNAMTIDKNIMDSAAGLLNVSYKCPKAALMSGPRIGEALIIAEMIVKGLPVTPAETKNMAETLIRVIDIAQQMIK